MAILVNPSTYVITIPRADLTLVSGTLYTLDTDVFRGWLKDWEDSEEGIVHPKTHNHNTEYTVAGDTYARAVIVLPPYSITFENGQYSVKLTGSNNNIWDVQSGILNQNQVQVIPSNSAGLIVKTVGSGVTEQDKLDIADRVWDESINGHTNLGSTGKALDNIELIKQIEGGRWRITNNQMIFYEEDNSTELMRFNLFDGNGQPAMKNIMDRVKV